MYVCNTIHDGYSTFPLLVSIYLNIILYIIMVNEFYMLTYKIIEQILTKEKKINIKCIILCFMISFHWNLIYIYINS